MHGPETPVIWTPLIKNLKKLGRRDVVCLSPPGFGAPVPDNFSATIDGYLDWLVEELAGFDAPVDILGHDWGGGHVMGVAMTRPDLLRSWASDIVGAFEPDYVWHPAAQIWQTPGDGEQHIEELFSGTVADRGSTNARDGNSARSSRVGGGGPGRGHGSRDAFAISVVQATGTSRQPAAGYQRQLSDLDWS